MFILCHTTFTGVIMVLAGAMEFEKSHNNEIVERPSDNEEIPAVSSSYLTHLTYLKGLYHRRFVYKLSDIPMNGVCQLCSEIKSISGNDNRRVKRTILSFKCVAIFRDKHYPNRSVHDAVYICCFNITIP